MNNFSHSIWGSTTCLNLFLLSKSDTDFPSLPKSWFDKCKLFFPGACGAGGGNKAFVWDLDRRGVVLLSQTVGGGWEDDAGIKSLGESCEVSSVL